MPAPLRLMYQLRENGGTYRCIKDLILDSRVDYAHGVKLVKLLEDAGIIKLDGPVTTKPRRVSLLVSDPDKWLSAIYQEAHVA